MADIDIVPKHRSRAWLWALLAIAVIVVLWMMMSGRDTATPRSSLEVVPSGLAAHVGPPAVRLT